MRIGDQYKTGQKSPANAYYKWVKYTDGTLTPEPTPEEKVFMIYEKWTE